MKGRNKVLLFILFCTSSVVVAQNLVTISPSHISMNIDTTGNSRFNRGIPTYLGHWGGFKLKLFVHNTTAESILLDSNELNKYQLSPTVLKANEKGYLSIYLKDILTDLKKQFDSTLIEPNYKLKIHFLHEDSSSFTKEINISSTLGRSKSVKLDQAIFELDQELMGIIEAKMARDTSLTYGRVSRIRIEKKIRITNLSNDSIFIPRMGVGWNDWGPHVDYYYSPTNEYLIPPKMNKLCKVQLNMGMRKRFDYSGYMIFFSKDYSKINLINTQFYSNLKPY